MPLYGYTMRERAFSGFAVHLEVHGQATYILIETHMRADVRQMAAAEFLTSTLLPTQPTRRRQDAVLRDKNRPEK